MPLLAQVDVQRVSVLGRVVADAAAVRVVVRVRLPVAVQHRLVVAAVVAVGAAERLVAEVVVDVVLHVVLEGADERTVRTRKELRSGNVDTRVVPDFLLQIQNL